MTSKNMVRSKQGNNYLYSKTDATHTYKSSLSRVGPSIKMWSVSPYRWQTESSIVTQSISNCTDAWDREAYFFPKLYAVALSTWIYTYRTDWETKRLLRNFRKCWTDQMAFIFQLSWIFSICLDECQQDNCCVQLS